MGTTAVDNEYTPAPRGLRGYVFIFILCSTQLFTQGALGYTLIPLNIIGKTFHQEGHDQAAQMAWHVAGYSLTVGSFILIAGKLGDIFGSKKILVIGWVWFGVWSIISGCSAFTGSAVFFDVSRAFQGIGPALLLPNALAIAGRTYPPGMKKNIVFSMIAMCAPLGGVGGGLLGAALAENVWWPWTLWISGIGCFVIALAVYPVVPHQRSNLQSDGKTQFDWIGSVFGIAGLVLLNVSWNQAPIDGWSTPYVYVLLILGFVFLGLFVWQERRAAQPIMDISIFNGRVAGVLVTIALGWSSFGIWFYYMFQFLQNLRGVSSLQSALQFLPGAISGMLAPIFTAWALSKIHTSYLLILASVAFFLGTTLIAFAPIDQSYWLNTFWSFVIMAWGMDVSFPASTVFISDAVRVEHQGISASLVNTVINYSMAIGLGIAGTVEVQVQDAASVVEGYRGAQYSSVALAGVGLLVSVLLAVLSRHEVADKHELQSAPEPGREGEI